MPPKAAEKAPAKKAAPAKTGLMDKDKKLKKIAKVRTAVDRQLAGEKKGWSTWVTASRPHGNPQQRAACLRPAAHALSPAPSC